MLAAAAAVLWSGNLAAAFGGAEAVREGLCPGVEGQRQRRAPEPKRRARVAPPSRKRPPLLGACLRRGHGGRPRERAQR
jgi:hypothetical protein